VRSLSYTTGVAVKNVGTIKDGIQHSVDRVVDKPISHAGFVNDSMFGIEDVEPVIGAMTISSAHKIVVQSKHIILKISLENLHILTSAFATAEFAPGGKKIF